MPRSIYSHPTAVIVAVLLALLFVFTLCLVQASELRQALRESSGELSQTRPSRQTNECTTPTGQPSLVLHMSTHSGASVIS